MDPMGKHFDVSFECVLCHIQMVCGLSTCQSIFIELIQHYGDSRTVVPMYMLWIDIDKMIVRFVR